MKHYYIIHGDFENRYQLFYAENHTDEIELIAAGATHISRADAIRYAREERERRKYNLNFSGYADTTIWPWGARGVQWKELDSTGYIVLKEV